MKVSDLMQAMSDAGAPMAAILIAVRALEERDAAAASAQDALVKKREMERDRKRRQRANARDSHGTVTGQVRDGHGTVTDTPALSPSPNENNSNPHPHTHPDNIPVREAEFRMVAWLAWLGELLAAKPKRSSRAKSAEPDRAKPHRMPEDWTPGPLPPGITALTDLWPEGRLAREAEACRDYWLDRTEKRPGWDRTFHNRIRQIHDQVLREARAYDRSQAHRSQPAQPSSNGLTEVLRRRGVYDNLGNMPDA